MPGLRWGVLVVGAAMLVGCAHSRGWKDEDGNGDRIGAIVGSGGEMPDEDAADGIPVPRTAPASASAREPFEYDVMGMRPKGKKVKVKQGGAKAGKKKGGMVMGQDGAKKGGGSKRR